MSAGPHIEEESVTKTTITITKHICANCGRLRSRKYHAENPIKEGETPVPAFCWKCQKDSSETSDSDRRRSPKVKNDEKKKPKDKEEKKKHRRVGSVCIYLEKANRCASVLEVLVRMSEPIHQMTRSKSPRLR